MSARVIAQLVVQGISIFGKAFISAYQQALHKGKAGGGPQTAAKIVKYKLHPDEALKIMNIERAEITKTLLDERYKKLFDSNDPAKGGSFYLQSKVFRSKEVLSKEFFEEEEKKEGPDGNKADAAAEGDNQSSSSNAGGKKWTLAE